VDLGVERARQRLAQVQPAEPDHPWRTRRARQGCGLHQALKIDRGVVSRGAELAGRFDQAHALSGTATIPKRQPGVEDGDQIEDLAMPGAHQPVDDGIGERPPQRRRHRNRVDDVAECAQPHDQETARRASGLHRVRLGRRAS
jgi:hypothetical protein